MSDRFRSTLCLGVAMLLCLCGLAAAEPKVELLWPDGAPGAKGDGRGRQADADDLPAAGGEGDRRGGRDLSRRRVRRTWRWTMRVTRSASGSTPSAWRASSSSTAISNSGAGYGHPAPLQDAQRAIRTVRSRAKEWGVDPDRIGILGFSAGGHLASSAATHFNESFGEPKDEIDRVSCRPDFAVLVYPGDLVHRALHARRLAQESARGQRGPGAGREDVERKAGDAADAADVPDPHLGGQGRPRREQHLLLSRPAQGQGAGGDAHLPQRPARLRPGPEDRSAPRAWPGLCEKWMEESGFLKSKSQK